MRGRRTRPVILSSRSRGVPFPAQKDDRVIPSDRQRGAAPEKRNWGFGAGKRAGQTHSDLSSKNSHKYWEFHGSRLTVRTPVMEEVTDLSFREGGARVGEESSADGAGLDLWQGIPRPPSSPPSRNDSRVIRRSRDDDEGSQNAQHGPCAPYFEILRRPPPLGGSGSLRMTPASFETRPSAAQDDRNVGVCPC
jgi:hypothetical protein